MVREAFIGTELCLFYV